MTKDLELRLIDGPAPTGEIPVKDLVALTAALQELLTRIGRDVVNRPGPGRTTQSVEEWAQLRLRAVETGSTVLRFSKGPTNKLDIELPEQKAADDRFWETMEAIQRDSRPDWVTDLIAESTVKLVRAMRDAAPRVALSDSAHPPIEIESNVVQVETWTSKRVQTSTLVEAKGRLEKVDLRSHEFRVRDDVGQAVELKRVTADTDAAQFVGQWVIATGEGTFTSGRLVALDNVSVSLLDDPASAFEHYVTPTLDELLACAPGPETTGGLDLTDDEFAVFLKAARG